MKIEIIKNRDISVHNLFNSTKGKGKMITTDQMNILLKYVLKYVLKYILKYILK